MLFILFDVLITFAVLAGTGVIAEWLMFLNRPAPILLRWFNIGCSFIVMGLALLITIYMVWLDS